jgi:hypothetical protein
MPNLARPARALTLAGILVAAAAQPALAAADAPPGNNGHVQIDEYDMDGGNGNDPHVACAFSVSFFGYDAGDQQATITVTPWAPTAGGTPFTRSATWHTDARTSGNQLDANVKIDPSAVADAFAGVAPAAQGWHAKVEVHVTGSQGADGKQKVIWITPCPEQATGTAGGSTGTNTPAPAPSPSTAPASGETSAGNQGAVLGESETAPSGAIAPATAAAAITAVPTTAG